jgi:hypothetical protein
VAAPNRSEQRQNLNVPTTMTLLAEVARQGCDPKEEGKEEGKLPAFWKLFGGTVLSIAAMVVVTAYQSLSSNAAEVRSEAAALNNEVRKEMGRLSEAQGELVKKDECDSRFKSMWRDLAELQEDKKDLVRLKEQCEKLARMRDQGEEGRRQLARDLQTLREERIRQKERQALREELAALRERLAGLEGKKPAKTAAPAAGKVGAARKAAETAGEAARSEVRECIPPVTCEFVKSKLGAMVRSVRLEKGADGRSVMHVDAAPGAEQAILHKVMSIPEITESELRLQIHLTDAPVAGKVGQMRKAVDAALAAVAEVIQARSQEWIRGYFGDSSPTPGITYDRVHGGIQ